MKTYEANEELAEILISQGLIETTSDINKEKGKRSFKPTINSKIEIYFDYINLRVIDSAIGQDSRILITEKELKSLLFYVKSSKIDFKEFEPSGKFGFEAIEKRLEYLENELITLVDMNLDKPKQEKINAFWKFTNTQN